MSKKTLLSLLLVSCWSIHEANAQGCSDAGVCSAGIMTGEGFSSENPKKAQVGVGYTLGQGDDSTTIHSVILEGAYAFTSKTFLQLNLPFHMVSGNLADTQGVGDLVLTLNQAFKQSGTHQFEGFIGARIATGQADLEENGLPLPMVYQTSLGTHDLLLGVKWRANGWSASLGYQQPIVQNNKNQFQQSLWAGTPNIQEYANSRELERSADIVARFEKAIPLKDLVVTLGLLPIYHVQKDSFLNAANQRVDIDGSDGLTLNVTGALDYQFTDAFGANLFLGAPIVTRDVQPDGLARNFVAGLSAFYRF